MIVIITESQLKLLVEKISDEFVICDSCGWKWKLSDGGEEPYLCHKCGYNNPTK